MADNNELAVRMKELYENRAKTWLTRRTPVILRIDGKCFHSFTKKFVRPYDKILHRAMNETMQYLCKNIQGCKLGYTQSDEISLLITDYDKLTTDAWFNYGVQKMCSIAASMATLAFNNKFREIVQAEYKDYVQTILEESKDNNCEIEEQFRIYFDCFGKAMFDARVFNIPESEIANYFIWRQQDATRNALQMLGQCNFSHKELQNVNTSELQEKLFTLKHINFNNMPVEFKRGVCCVREQYYPEPLPGYEGCPVDTRTVRFRWVLDTEIPIFSHTPSYITNSLKVSKV